jgi:serine/threonine protein phosphatase 1
MPRHLAIGDIHGCNIALKALLECVQLESDDVVITLGDYVNRGPGSCAVIETLIELAEQYTVYCLRGNHELMLMDAKENPIKFAMFLGVGGDNTLESYRLDGHDEEFPDLIPAEHWDFFEQHLLPYFETETHFFVHAGAYAEIPLADQPEFMLYWEKWNDPPKHDSGKIMVCGHTSQKSGLPLFNGNAVCIDTWACGGGWLSCLHAESGKIWQANQDGETRTMWLDELPTDSK